MTTPNDGGPAFPAPERKTFEGVCKELASSGMSLRDWFAGQALAGLASYYARHPFDRGLDAKVVADYCVALADAMLAARALDAGGKHDA